MTFEQMCLFNGINISRIEIITLHSIFEMEGKNVRTAWSIQKNDKYLCANEPNLNFPSFNEGIPSNHANLCIWFHRFCPSCAHHGTSSESIAITSGSE